MIEAGNDARTTLAGILHTAALTAHSVTADLSLHHNCMIASKLPQAPM